MLQQTTVAAVVPYFERFVSRFPNVQTLAAAPEQDVLRLWEGLGYYTRARNIHRTAGLIVCEHGGRFPETVDALQRLPGIGRYTAGAIVSFAFDRPAPIVEANTRRLYARLAGYRVDLTSTEGQRWLWGFAERIVPRRSPGRFNQALMELGATVCTPAEPRCDECPVRKCCQAAAAGAQGEIPALARRPAVTDVTEAYIAVRRNGRYLLRLRGSQERWAGLWDFPRYADGDRPPAQLMRTACESLKLDVQIVRQIAELRHGVTRFRIRLVCYLAECRSGRVPSRGGLRWVRPSEFEKYPLSMTGRKLAGMLRDEPAGSAG
jgi:A/G-specific adenine glycosylase